MDTERSRRLHAARVAAMATAVVLVVYVIAVIALNVVVARRLTAQVDLRLSSQLAEARTATVHLPVTSGEHLDLTNHDPDDDIDAPAFVWSVTGSGVPTALSPNSPTLPHRTWDGSAPVAFELAGATFRFQSVPVGSGWLVAGQSTAQVGRVRDALLTPELLLGLALLVVVYAGSLIIGLRASAPLELIHRRQVEFTADASHELRTPLSVIEAEVALALSRPRTSVEYQDVLGRIAGEGGRLRHIVDDLLWLARVEDGRSTARAEEFADVGQVALACADRFRSVAAARGVTVDSSVGGDEPPVVHADPDWIDRLVGVLVDNACKYAATDGNVDVTVTASGTRVVLQVDDDGPGISPEERALVFDRFHRGADEPGGTGLGLAIADSVVRISSGTWTITRAPSGGARMEVSWRRAVGRKTAADGLGPRASDPVGDNEYDDDTEPGAGRTTGPNRDLVTP